jgi:superfamily II DNA/RNA helicase
LVWDVSGGSCKNCKLFKLQVYRVAKSISHHARFRSTMVSGGTSIRPQEDSLNMPADMVVGTPGRILDHIKDGNLVYGDIKYLVCS